MGGASGGTTTSGSEGQSILLRMEDVKGINKKEVEAPEVSQPNEEKENELIEIIQQENM